MWEINNCSLEYKYPLAKLGVLAWITIFNPFKPDYTLSSSSTTSRVVVDGDYLMWFKN